MKQTEIGLIPDDWEVIKILGNYFLKGRIGWQGLKASEFKDQGPYLVTGTDFVNGRVNWNTCYHISEKRYEEDKALHVREDDILITKDGTIGKVAYVDKKPEKVSLNSHLLIIRPLKDKLLNRYLYYILNSKFFYDYYQQTQTGTTMASLSQDKISKFVYPLPSKEEQQRIAKALSDVDALISTTEKLLQKKKNIKQGTMQNLLTGKKRLPGFAKSTRTKMTELGEIPEDWEVQKVSEFGSFCKGSGISREESNTGELPAVRYGELYTAHNDYIKTFESHISNEVASKSKRLKHGDLLFTCSGETKEDIGKCVAFLGNEEAYAGGDLLILSPTINIDSLFYGFLLNTKIAVKQKSSMAQGDAVVHISAESIGKVLVPFPSKEEQTAIANVLSSMDKEIETLNTKLEKYRNLKTAMMQQLLSGKIRLV